MTITQEATGTPPAPDPIVLAEALHQLGRLVEAGLPAPTGIVCNVNGEVVVNVAYDDLPAWMGFLDLPAPEWVTTHSADGEWISRSAAWPDAVMLELLFRLTSGDTVAATATAQAPDPALCPPGCWAHDLGIAD